LEFSKYNMVQLLNDVRGLNDALRHLKDENHALSMTLLRRDYELQQLKDKLASVTILSSSHEDRSIRVQLHIV